MLESGDSVFDCQIDKQLSDNNIYASYLTRCVDGKTAKLFLLHPDPLLNQRQQHACIEQASWLSSQAFPGVGVPLNAGEIDGQLAYLYLRPQGRSLRQTLVDGYSAQQAVVLLQKIATHLSAVHNAGFWHGNISPENIYIDAASPYLAEFALSQLIRLDFHSGIDPQYTSPEQVRGETSSSASDIYSLGCILYHLLTGGPPFSGDEPFAIAKQHLQGEFPPLPESLQVLQPLLIAMTELSSAERITVDELIHNIGDIAESHLLDQIETDRSSGDHPVEDSPTTASVSLLDEALDSSELAARIEARLKEHATEFHDSEPLVSQIEEAQIDTVVELDQVVQENKTGFGRLVLILLLGIAIGSGLYFFLSPSIPGTVPAVVESTVIGDDTTIADLDLGLQLWQDEDFNGAEAEFKNNIAANPEDPRAYNNLAAFYAAQGNYEQARDYLEQALATDEKYATIYRNLGSVYAEMARGAYGRALQINRLKETVSLPVFSSKGVVKLQSDTTVAGKSLVPAADTATATASLSTAGEQISASVATLNPESEETPAVSPVNQSPPAVKIAEEAQAHNTEELIVAVAQQGAPDNDGKNEDVATDLSSEKPESFLQRWAQAWSNQDVDAYLSFYGEQFVPPAGRSRADWEAQRRTRIRAPKEIQVTLDAFQVIPGEDKVQQVELIQSYTSNLLSDRFKKVFDLQQTDNGWKIVRERSIGRVR
ncbi:Serine/threonine protein kinase [Desulfuromusa kysingii]|uniref:Serine/threonine protein kinase n=1 Tax=Desulfuromusa kysingii TaxID=37625 RepID=A0A1H3Y9L7_9BACT|nr:tetratricopeptide repeat protein [Desulfuromusa kysingii]SEA08309.1 Serine/threonine protein kinase [Desulfuromusa kysingii]